MQVSRTFELRTLAALALLAASAPTLAGQTVGGRIVDLKSKKPVGAAAVALVDDSARVVASTTADSATGAFYVDAPKPGRYRVVLFVAGGSFLSPAMDLAAGQTEEHEFSVPEVPTALRGALFAPDVTTPARPLPSNPAPTFPTTLRAQGARALVSTMFIVGQDGVPDVGSLQVLADVDSAFVAAIRDALGHARFIPATKDGAAVAQVAQVTYDFGLPGDPPRGDVMIRADAAGGAQQGAAPAEKPRGGNLYLITRDELRSPALSGMNLYDAIRTIRPRMFAGFPPTVFGKAPAPLAVFVDDQRIDASEQLSTLTPRQVLEVRLFKPEEAQVKYGTQYSGGVLLVRLVH